MRIISSLMILFTLTSAYSSPSFNIIKDCETLSISPKIAVEGYKDLALHLEEEKIKQLDHYINSISTYNYKEAITYLQEKSSGSSQICHDVREIISTIESEFNTNLTPHTNIQTSYVNKIKEIKDRWKKNNKPLTITKKCKKEAKILNSILTDKQNNDFLGNSYKKAEGYYYTCIKNINSPKVLVTKKIKSKKSGLVLNQKELLHRINSEREAMHKYINEKYDKLVSEIKNGTIK